MSNPLHWRRGRSTLHLNAAPVGGRTHGGRAHPVARSAARLPPLTAPSLPFANHLLRGSKRRDTLRHPVSSTQPRPPTHGRGFLLREGVGALTTQPRRTLAARRLGVHEASETKYHCRGNGLVEASMRYALQLSILVLVLGGSAAVAADRIQLAQSSQTVAPLPPPQLLPQSSLAGTCAITCNSAAMSCLNTCVALFSHHAGQSPVQPELHHAAARVQTAVLVADLTFAPHLAAGPRSECQIQNSTSTLYLLVVL